MRKVNTTFRGTIPRHLNHERQETMTIKEGSIVSHPGALQWGAGKVLVVTDSMVTISFSDGKERKIAASHFGILQPADKVLYLPPPASDPAKPVRPASRKAGK